MPIVKCAWCKDKFNARQADLNRGWGKFCSKSCKAKKQEKKTGAYANYKFREARRGNDCFDDYNPRLDDYDPSWDAHKY